MNFNRRLALCVPIFFVASSVAHAADGTWIDTTASGNWTDSTKWSGGPPGIIADGAGFTASFTSDITAATTVSLNGTNRSIGNLVFSDNGAAGSAWTISGNILTLGDNGAAVLAPTINTITNATITSNLAGNDGFTKSGTGTLTIQSAGAALTGTVMVNQGTLDLKMTSGSGVFSNGNVALVLGGGMIKQTWNAGGVTNATTFSSTTLNAGSSIVSTDQGAGSNTTGFNLAGLTRNVGGTLQVIDGGSFCVVNTTTINANGILGGYATFGTDTWAIGSTTGTNTTIAGLATYTNNLIDGTTTTANVNVNASFTAAAGSTANSLRLNGSAGNTVTLAGATTLTSGGILMTTVPTANSTIQGGTLAGAAGKDLIILQNNTTQSLNISSSIVDNTSATGLTKSGVGALNLSGTNTYTGNTFVNTGVLNLASAGSLKFLIGANGVNNAIAGTGTLTLNGAFVLDLTNAAAAGSWQLVDNANLTETYSSTFNLAGFTDNGNDTWTKTANGATYTFSEATGALTAVPEPGAVLLGGLGLLALLRRRRA